MTAVTHLPARKLAPPWTPAEHLDELHQAAYRQRVDNCNLIAAARAATRLLYATPRTQWTAEHRALDRALMRLHEGEPR